MAMNKEEIIREINWVRKDFVNLCIEIAQECREGEGTNYELLCLSAWEGHYEPKIARLATVLGKDGEQVKIDMPEEFFDFYPD